MVWKIFCKYAYPALESSHSPVLSFEEWMKPNMYFIDPVNKKELATRCEDKEYLSSEIETFNEWYESI